MAAKKTADTVTDMFSAFGQSMHIPQVDVESILAHHRKNFEALQRSAAAGTSGAQAIIAKQRDLIQEQMREVAEMAQSFRPGGDPQNALARQAEFVKKSFETAVRNVSEVSTIMQSSGAESVDILRQRIRDSMEEIRAAYERGK